MLKLHDNFGLAKLHLIVLLDAVFFSFPFFRESLPQLCRKVLGDQILFSNLSDPQGLTYFLCKVTTKYVIVLAVSKIGKK